MIHVWDGFEALGPWAALIVPGVVLLLAVVGALGWRYAPRLVPYALALGVFAGLTLALGMTMRPAAEVGVRLTPHWNPLPTLMVIITGTPSAYGTRMDALGNLLLLLPLGAALALLAGNRVAALLVVAVALSLETTQWLLATGRSPETADVLLNAAGGVAGIGLAWAACRLAGVPSDA